MFKDPHIKGPQAQITAQERKKKTFPEYPVSVNLRHSSDIKKASCVFRQIRILQESRAVAKHWRKLDDKQ